MPNYFPGYQKVDDPEIRAKFEKAWNVSLPPKPGLDNHMMIDAIHDGHLKAMYVFGEEMSLVDSNANYVADALSKLDFFVMQEIFFTETCRFADVILPASPSLEKEGTFTSTERRIQRLHQVFEPLEESRPDWQIIQDIANRLGAGWSYEHPSQIYDEIAPLTPLMAGVTYERLEGYKTLQWPVAEDGSVEDRLRHLWSDRPHAAGPVKPIGDRSSHKSAGGTKDERWKKRGAGYAYLIVRFCDTAFTSGDVGSALEQTCR
jgi:formate dehydrogenase major subunit